MDSDDAEPSTAAAEIVKRIGTIEAEARDNLLAAKISQTLQADAHRRPDENFSVGDSVFLSTSNHRREYMHAGDNRVAKFMPRFDGPYKIIHANPDKSSYTLDLPNADNIFPTFHSSHLRRFVPNDGNLFPSRVLELPAPVTTDLGDDEYFVDRIIDERQGRRGQEFLVTFRGYGAEENRWMSRREVEELEALDNWLASKAVHVKSTRSWRTCNGSSNISSAVLHSVLDSLPDDFTLSLDYAFL